MATSTATIISGNTTTAVTPRSLSEIRANISTALKGFNKAQGEADRFTIDLWVNTYLYAEQALLEYDMTVGDVMEELADFFGGSINTWTDRRRYGAFIRNHKIKSKAAMPSSIITACNHMNRLSSSQQKSVKSMLNDGAPNSAVNDTLERVGARPIQKVPVWKSRAIRKQKLNYADWEPELQRVMDGVKFTAAGKGASRKLELVLRVNGRDTVVVSSRSA